MMRPSADRLAVSVVLRSVALLGEPESEVGSPVADVPANLEASRSAAEVAPVAQGAFGDPQEGAGFLGVSMSSPGCGAGSAWRVVRS